VTTATASRREERAGHDLASVARGGLANLVGAVVSALANLALVLVVARLVSPRAAGLFFTITSLFLLLETLGKLGADTSIVYFVARWRALGQADRIRIGLRVAFAPCLVLSAFASLATFVFAPRVAGIIGDDAGTSVALLRVLAVVLPLAAVYDIAIAATRGFSRMRPTVLIEKIGRPTAQVLLVAIVLAVGWDGALGYAWGTPYLVTFGVAVYVLRRSLHGQPGTVARARPTQVRPIAKEFWTFSLPRAAAGVAQIAIQRLDIVLVASMRGVVDAAIYTAATRFLVVGQFVNQAISAPLQPRLSAALSTKAMDHARQLYRASTAWLVLATWPIFGAAIVFASWYVAAFGSGYQQGASVVIVLSVAMLVASAVGVVDNVIIMAGKASWNLGTTVLALVVNVVMDLALIPHFGLMGAAAGWCGAIVASNLVPLWITWRALGLDPFGRGTLLACLLCGVSFIGVPVLARLISGGSAVGAGVGFAIGVCCYIFGIWCGRRAFDLSGLIRRRSL
jgi:O-antigen/teichoic acid export membrane protein